MTVLRVRSVQGRVGGRVTQQYRTTRGVGNFLLIEQVRVDGRSELRRRVTEPDRAKLTINAHISGRMWPVGWEALEQWGDDVARIEQLAGGVVNEVWSVRVNGQLAVGRLGARSDADLAWETDLLRHLDREGLTVPVPIATTVWPAVR